MSEPSAESTITRRATPRDLPAILELLAEFDLPSAYFEPFYLSDPTYVPEHSWVVEENDRVIAHVRGYDRVLRLDTASFPICGLGNVITARTARGRGHAGQLLGAFLQGVGGRGPAYSLLWTHIPGMYARFGWAPIQERLVRTVVGAEPIEGLTIAPFRDDDLSAVADLYASLNARRTGTTVRSLDYWRGQTIWLDADRSGFLVARMIGGDLGGYVRSSPGPTATEILEIGAVDDDPAVGRSLLGAVAVARQDGQIEARLPPSLERRLIRAPYEVLRPAGLMGRTLSIRTLMRALAPLWRRRLASAESTPDGSFTLSTGGGDAHVRVRDGELTVSDTNSTSQDAVLGEGELAHLLFHGFDDAAAELIGRGPPAAVLAAVFPEQDFVIWPADAF